MVRGTAWLLVVLLIGQNVPLLAADYFGQVTFNGLPVPGATVTAVQGEGLRISAGCRHETTRSDIEGRPDPVQRPDRPDPAWALRLPGDGRRSIRPESGLLAGPDSDRSVGRRGATSAPLALKAL